MEESFSQWRDSSKLGNASFVISDSEDEVVESSSKGFDKHIIDESNDEDISISSELITPKRNTFDHKSTPISSVKKNIIRTRKCKIIDSDDSTDDSIVYKQFDNKAKGHTIDDSRNIDDNNFDSDEDADKDHDSSIAYSPIKNKTNKRKDISHDYTKEDIKELKHNSFNESVESLEIVAENNSKQQNINTDNKIDMKDEMSHKSKSVVVDLLSSESEESETEAEAEAKAEAEAEAEAEAAIMFAKQEIGTKNIDPIAAQSRTFIVHKLEQLKNKLASTKMLTIQGNLKLLPDKGERLYKSIDQYEKEIKELTLQLENIPLIESSTINETEVTKEPQKKNDPYSHFNFDNIPMNQNLMEMGRKAQETWNKELALTVERLQDLHGSLIGRPSENERAEDPRGLKVKLMPHQQHALAWLLWREKQRPSGGVLADDMGLGKTLTMISLIITTLADEETDESDDSDDEWHDNKPIYHKGGSLIVCPASLLSQWESEVQNKCKRGLLSVEVYHGGNRENVPKRLAKNNMVITTYNILSREHKINSTLYQIKWKRVILDEAHVIRNHKSKASEAACKLMANKRWAISGTPIQNKELDLYSLLKFLKCTPFDDLRVWKRWVDNKVAAGHERLATVMKTLMLRRTKQELMAKGDLNSLPDKYIEEVMVKLDPQEQLVYEKILVYSRTLFAQFLAQKAEKDHMFELHSGKYDKPTFLSNPNKETQFTKAQNKLLAMHADVKAHEILVLLLRLRQVCCHPALIHAILDQEDVKQSGIMDMENMDSNLLSRMNNMSLNNIETPEKEEIDIDQRMTENLLTAKNPVFDNHRISSKMKVLIDMVKEILQKGDDKLIIVSQWATLLDVIALRLSSVKGATFSKFTGGVAIKDRQGIMDSFNNPNSNLRILLLSLTAGGVGLNLIGANHLLLFDIHWNPQLETQAQDRIYRFGQTKNVYIYKFICNNTIEERIKTLQERKIEIAKNVLTGDAFNTGAKLTLNDLKSLFAL